MMRKRRSEDVYYTMEKYSYLMADIDFKYVDGWKGALRI